MKFLSHQVIVFARHSIGSSFLGAHGIEDIRVNRSLSYTEKKNAPRGEIVCMSLTALYGSVLKRSRCLASVATLLIVSASRFWNTRNENETRSPLLISLSRTCSSMYSYTNISGRICTDVYRDRSYANLLIDFTTIKPGIFSMSSLHCRCIVYV